MTCYETLYNIFEAKVSALIPTADVGHIWLDRETDILYGQVNGEFVMGFHITEDEYNKYLIK